MSRHFDLLIKLSPLAMGKKFVKTTAFVSIQENQPWFKGFCKLICP
jgi:hypothetical protein